MNSTWSETFFVQFVVDLSCLENISWASAGFEPVWRATLSLDQCVVFTGTVSHCHVLCMSIWIANCVQGQLSRLARLEDWRRKRRHCPFLVSLCSSIIYLPTFYLYTCSRLSLPYRLRPAVITLALFWSAFSKRFPPAFLCE